MSQLYDVLVVGAGLAGLECARRLGLTGASVLLVDRKRSVDQHVHTTGIFVRRTLESFELPHDCLGPPVRRVVLYSPSGKALALESRLDEFRVGRMAELYRRELDTCLHLGVTWSPETTLTALDPLPQGSAATFQTGGRSWRARARFVIGADGATSQVGPALGLDANREWIVGAEEVYHRAHTTHRPAFHVWLDPALAPGYIAWVVDDGEEVHVGVGGYPARFVPAEALRRFSDQVAGRFHLRGAEISERRGGRIPVGGVLPRIANARGLLVGDAAGAVSPLTAGGLDPCLRLSELAAGVTTDYLAAGNGQALARYSGEALRRHFRSRLLLRRVLASVRAPAVAELGCAVLRLPPFRGVVHKVFFGRGSFPDLVG